MRLIHASYLSTVTALAASGLALAQQEEQKPDAAEIATGANLALANQLALYGNQNDNALALIVAAQIKKQIPMTEGDDAERTSPAGAQPAAKTTGEGSSVEELLARARELAGSQEDLLGLIQDVEAMSSRGDLAGAGCYNASVLAGYTDTWRIAFSPGSNWVELDGDGDTDLDLEVYSGDNRLLCSSLGYSDNEFCSWRQSRTGTIRVEVSNLGRVYNNYYLCTN